MQTVSNLYLFQLIYLPTRPLIVTKQNFHFITSVFCLVKSYKVDVHTATQGTIRKAGQSVCIKHNVSFLYKYASHLNTWKIIWQPITLLNKAISMKFNTFSCCTIIQNQFVGSSSSLSRHRIPNGSTGAAGKREEDR